MGIVVNYLLKHLFLFRDLESALIILLVSIKMGFIPLL